ncbi:MAG: hypothetical protein ABIP75_03430 [Pyrinomonadaceae bacterium]
MREPLNGTLKPRYQDPIVELYKKDVDRTLIRHNLTLTVDQRFEQLMRLQELAIELRRAGKEARLGR